MSSSRPTPNAAPTFSSPVAAFVEAINSGDLEGLLSTFAEDALVNDQLCDYWGRTSIREWAERDIIGLNLRMAITTAIEHHGNVVVTANIDGEFDKRGLPDPLVLAFYFTIRGNHIVELIILRNRTDI